MAKLKKYDLEGKEVGTVEIDDSLIQQKANPQMIKDYIVAIRNNGRQWSASTKGRSDVKCTNKKPHPQKGTGKARQGTLAAPQFKGGGIVFGPKPKFNQHVRINQRERRAAVNQLISEKISSNQIYVLSLSGMNAPKTKIVSKFLKTVGLEGQKILFLGKSNRENKEQTECENFVKSTRNIPRVGFMPAYSISGYDVINAHRIVIVDEAVDELKEVLGRASK